ncbi:hypothetical protein JW962_03440 [Candidatus Dojkabacteria bacterium]|nr:hypothetical protein [Candidatus Dojkabacteria bacterium]
MATKLRPLIVNDEIDLIAVWQRIQKGWVTILLCAILLGGVGAVGATMLPEKYEVSAIMQVPYSWGVTPDVVTEIIDKYVESSEFAEKGSVSYSILKGTTSSSAIVPRFQILFTTKAKDIKSGEQLLEDVLKGLQSNDDLGVYANMAVTRLKDNLDAIEIQLADAYEKQAMFDALIAQGDSSVIVGSNPVEINESILDLVESRSELADSVALDSDVYWAVSPNSNGNNVQLSSLILGAVGAFLGAGVGFVMVLFKKWK